jgi:hypothetical protein
MSFFKTPCFKSGFFGTPYFGLTSGVVAPPPVEVTALGAGGGISIAVRRPRKVLKKNPVMDDDALFLLLDDDWSDL